MAIIFKGYKIPGTDICNLEAALNEIKEKAELKAKRIYAELLAKEIEIYVDDIALNILPRPQDASIYEKCVIELNNKIAWAISNSAPTVYNLSVHSSVFTYKNDMYIRLNIPNERLVSELNKIPNLASFDFSDRGTASSEEIANVWDEIREIYPEATAYMHRQLCPNGPFDVKWKNISQYFHTPSERLDLRVRYTLTSELLNLIGMKKEIPNVRLLHYLDEAMLMLEQPLIKKEALARKNKASTVFVNITESLVKKDPRDKAPETFEESEVDGDE